MIIDMAISMNVAALRLGLSDFKTVVAPPLVCSGASCHKIAKTKIKFLTKNTIFNQQTTKTVLLLKIFIYFFQYFKRFASKQEMALFIRFR